MWYFANELRNFPENYKSLGEEHLLSFLQFYELSSDGTNPCENWNNVEKNYF